MIRIALIFALSIPALASAGERVPTENELYAAAKALPMPSLTRKLRRDAAKFRAEQAMHASVGPVKGVKTGNQKRLR